MKQDMTGKRFGRLQVLEAEQRGQGRKRYWRCRCQCGNEVVVEESHLKDGHTRSCGCLRRELMQKRSVDITGERFGRLVAVKKTADGNKWECQCDCGNTCVCTKENLRSGITRSCGCLREEQRKENMKKAIHFVNGTCVERIASRKTFSNNTTGHRGVYRRENNRWRASIGFQGKVYNLGSFAVYEEAVRARLEAEERLYDEFLREYGEGQKDGKE